MEVGQRRRSPPRTPYFTASSQKVREDSCSIITQVASTVNTVWKNDKFTATKILREINF